MPYTALIVVDVQRDFCPGGALPVPEGDRVVEPINRLVQAAEAHGLPIVYTRDWHPPDHVSFRERGGTWPVHCVRDTPGAEFHEGLILARSAIIVSKATQPDEEAYSGFQGTQLEELLRGRGVRRVIITGLATDYCVKATALDALERGFETWVVREAVRGVDVNPGDSRRALAEIESRGGRVVGLNEALAAVQSPAGPEKPD